MTVAPAATASWVAMEPTPPVAPEMSTVSPAWMLSASSASCAAMPARPMTAACWASTPSGTAVTSAAASATYSVKLPVLGPSAMPGIKGDPVPDGDALDAVADRVDGADEVAAEHDRELDTRNHVPDVAGGDRQVEAVDRGGLDLDEDLA